MRRLKWICFWLLILLLTGALGGVGSMIFWMPTPKVSWSNWEKLRKGMTRDEVRAILGEPRDTFLIAAGGEPVCFDAYREAGRLVPWQSDRLSITVYYTDDKMERAEIVPWERTWRQRLTQWFPW
jgi:hypothetical protein